MAHTVQVPYQQASEHDSNFISLHFQIGRRRRRRRQGRARAGSFAAGPRIGVGESPFFFPFLSFFCWFGGRLANPTQYAGKALRCNTDQARHKRKEASDGCLSRPMGRLPPTPSFTSSAVRQILRGLRDGPDAGTSARYLYLARSVFAVPAALMHALLCGIPYFNILLPVLRPPRPGEAANHHATWTLGCSIWHERGLES